jgi:hypothetical protein
MFPVENLGQIVRCSVLVNRALSIFCTFPVWVGWGMLHAFLHIFSKKNLKDETQT